MDLAVGEPARLVASSLGHSLDRDDRGHLYVYWSIATAGSELLLAEADRTAAGLDPLEQLGSLPRQPSLDLDGDRYDDLLVSARALTCSPPISLARPARSISSTASRSSSHCRHRASRR